MFTWERVADELARVYDGVLMAPLAAAVTAPVWRGLRRAAPSTAGSSTMASGHAIGALQTVAHVSGTTAAAANAGLVTARASLLAGR